MRRSTLVYGLVAVMALGGLMSLQFAFQAAPNAPAGSIDEPKSDWPSARTQSCLDSARCLLRDFLEHSYADPSPSELRQLLADKGYRLGYFLAAVPDPANSSFDSRFDQYVDAIRAAFEESGYLLDRWTMPVVPDGKEVDAKRAQLSPIEERALQDRPGVLLFRRAGDHELVLVYLVGETPTSGIRKAHLSAAAWSAWQLLGKPAWFPLYILGPSFSGSVPSLGLAIADFATSIHSQVSVRIVSGTTKALNNDVLAAAIGLDAHPNVELLPPTHLLVPERAMRCRFYQLLAQRGVNVPAEVALLRESNTFYGQSGGGCQTENGHTDINPKTVLAFPLHISQLRRAYEAGRRSQDQKAGTPDLPRRLLELSLEESRNADDVLPSVSRATTHSVELVLASVLRGLARDRFRYVGIIATDPRDVVFLGQEVRRHAPNTTLFTFSSDVLFLHDDVSFLRGMLVGSNFPLLDQNQRWTRNAEPSDPGVPIRGAVFPREGTQGIFNGTLAVLDEMRATVLQKDEHFYAEHAREAVAPFTGSVAASASEPPPIWFTLVGAGGFYPLAAEPAGAPPRTPHWVTIETPNVFRALFFLIGLFALFNCFGYWNALVRRRRGEDGTGRFWPDMFDSFFLESATLSDLSPLASGELPVLDASPTPAPANDSLRDRIATRALAFVCFGSLFVGYALMAAAFMIALVGQSKQSLLDYLDLAFAVVCSSALLVTWIASAWMPRYARPRDEAVPDALASGGGEAIAIAAEATTALPFDRIWLSVAGAVVITMLLLLIGGLGAAQLAVAENWWFYSQWVFFHERAVNLGGGVSILLPVLLLAGASYLWSLCQLKRLRLLTLKGEIGQVFRDLRPQDDALELLHHRNRIVSTLNHRFLSWKRLVVVLFLVAVPGLNLAIRSLGVHEGRTADVALRVFFLLVATAVVFSALRYLMLWLRLRQLLRQLALHPSVYAYERLPIKSIDSVGLPLDAAAVAVKDPELLKSHQRLLANQHRYVAGRLKRLLRLTDDAAQRLQDALEQRADYIQIVSREVVATLVEYWRRRPLIVALDRAKPLAIANCTSQALATAVPDDTHLWLRLAEDHFALQVVLFINYVLAHMRNLLSFVTAAVMLTLLALTCYPYQPQHFLAGYGWLVAGVLGVMTAIVLVQSNRDEVLSRISGSEPGRVSWDWTFVSSVMVHSIFPVLTILATQVPGVGRTVFALLRVFEK